MVAVVGGKASGQLAVLGVEAPGYLDSEVSGDFHLSAKKLQTISG